MKSMNARCHCGEMMNTEVFYAKDEIYFAKAECAKCGNEVKFDFDDETPTNSEGTD